MGLMSHIGLLSSCTGGTKPLLFVGSAMASGFVCSATVLLMQPLRVVVAGMLPSCLAGLLEWRTHFACDAVQ